MKNYKRFLIFSLVLAIIAGIVFTLKISSPENIASGEEMVVYHSSDCSCCDQYAKIMERKGFEVEREIDNMNERINILNEAEIPRDMTSCHISLVDGYYFEGHIPAKVIKKVLNEKPEIDGLVLPDMPSGSPGMPGTKTEDWKIYKGVNGEFTKFITF